MSIDLRGMTPLIQVFDMATSLKFYCDVLGFDIVQTDSNSVAPNHNWLWLRRDNIDLMLNTAYEYDKRPQSPDPRRIARHGDTGLFIGAPDVDAVFAHLRTKGVDVEKAEDCALWNEATLRSATPMALDYVFSGR
jgi:glyoxylase I family protein